MKITIPGKKGNVWSMLGEQTLPVNNDDIIDRIIPLNSRRDAKKFIAAYDSIEIFAEKENIKKKFLLQK